MLSLEIQRLRKRRGFTQRSFAEAVGISPGTIAPVEAGRLVLSEARLHQIADRLGLDNHERAALLHARAVDLGGEYFDPVFVREFVDRLVEDHGPVGAAALLQSALDELRSRPRVDPHQGTIDEEQEARSALDRWTSQGKRPSSDSSAS